MFTPSAKRNIFASSAVVIILTAIALVFVCSSPIRVLDPRFHVISVTVSRGTNQPIYFESQLTGRVKEAIRNLGLGVQPAKKVTVTLRDNTYIALAVVYSGDFAPLELGTVDAELADSAGKVTLLEQGFHAPNPKGSNYLGTWIQRLQSTNSPSYCLRLKLPNNGGHLAEIKLGKLSRKQ